MLSDMGYNIDNLRRLRQSTITATNMLQTSCTGTLAFCVPFVCRKQNAVFTNALWFITTSSVFIRTCRNIDTNGEYESGQAKMQKSLTLGMTLNMMTLNMLNTWLSCLSSQWFVFTLERKEILFVPNLVDHPFKDNSINMKYMFWIKIFSTAIDISDTLLIGRFSEVNRGGVEAGSAYWWGR